MISVVDNRNPKLVPSYQCAKDATLLLYPVAGSQDLNSKAGQTHPELHEEGVALAN
jgi:hypothetical protein